MMQMTPKISVVMAVHNRAAFVRECIESILGQDYGDFELIVIDDASTDHSGEILSSIKDERIIRITNDRNLGLPESLNKGLKIAKGEYIARHDDDDLSAPSRFSKQIRFMESHPDIMLLGTGYFCVNENGSRQYAVRMITESEHIKAVLPERNIFCHGTAMFRRKILSEVGVYRKKILYTEDYDYWLRIADRFEVANLPEPLYYFRRWSGSVTKQKALIQAAYHFLCVELSKERTEKGSDSLDRYEIDDIEDFLVHHLGIPKADLTRLQASLLMDQAYQALKLKNKTGSFRCLKKALQVDFAPWRIKDYCHKFFKYSSTASTSNLSVDRHKSLINFEIENP